MSGDVALFVHYMDPHLSYAPPDPYDQMFVDPNYDGRVEGASQFPEVYEEIGPADEAHLEALYDGELAFTDWRIGRLMARLSRRFDLTRAVIVYTADHGEEFRDHGGWRHGGTLYEEVVRVPFALQLPGFDGRRISEPVSLVDLAPTVLRALEVPVPASFQGRDLTPELERHSIAVRPVFAETLLFGDKRRRRVSVRLGQKKYIGVVPRDAEGEYPLLSEEFYDLRSDPEERASDLSSPDVPVLRQALMDYLRSAEGRAAAPVAHQSEETLKRLQELGYVE
jgi:arylsulfatase A-like enzyme